MEGIQENRERVTVEYAGFWIRLAAYLIDGVILAVIGWIAVILVELTGYEILPGEDGIKVAALTGESAGEPQALLTVIGVVIEAAYCICFWTWRGQTPGKMALGIKIIRADGSPIGPGRSILRYIGSIISGLLLMIGYLWIAFDSRKQGIHDKIAGTYVIRLPRKKAALPEIYV